MMLAQKYAHAFINVFGSVISYDEVRYGGQAASYLYHHRRALFLLKISTLDDEVKRKGLRELCQKFKLPAAFETLIDLLLHDGRAYLFAAVLDVLVLTYRKVHAIAEFHVTSASVLKPDTRVFLEKFMNGKTTSTNFYTYDLNQSLIAGVRMQSDTLLWEYSIDKKLRALARMHQF